MKKTSHKVTLANKWTCEFSNRGEFAMGCEYWGMILYGPNGESIFYFQDKIVVVNDFNGKKSKSCIELSNDGNYGYLRDDTQESWVIDFKHCKIAPHRIYIRHQKDDQSVSVFEQPAFRMAQEYIEFSSKKVYLTFPFYRDDEMQKIWDEYVSIRNKQIEELYFKI